MKDQDTSLLVESDAPQSRIPWSKILVIGVILLALLVLALALFIGLTLITSSSCPLTTEVLQEDVQTCLAKLNDIGNQHGNRAVNTPGYAASVEYILSALADKNLNVSVQTFTYQTFQVQANPELKLNNVSLTYQTDYNVVEGSPSGESLLPTPVSFVGEGCDALAYVGFTQGHIALVKRGTCTFARKAEEAWMMNASAVVIFNDVAGLVSTRILTEIPAFIVTNAVGTALSSFVENPALAYKFTTGIVDITTQNIIAETFQGDDTKIVIAGAHLDGVPAGNGINDNGSGSCLLLSLALAASRNCNPKQQLIFAWFGAEEVGLLGSKHFVEAMTEEQRTKVALNVNFDMMGSPNYVLGVHNGSTAPLWLQEQSILIQNQFEKFFNANSIPYSLTPMGRGSDYAFFLDNGIAAGGLATGASGLKTYKEKDIFGGVALAQYDLCYHQKCDTRDNIDEFAMKSNVRAAASVVEIFAVDSELVAKIAERTNFVKVHEGSSKEGRGKDGLYVMK